MGLTDSQMERVIKDARMIAHLFLTLDLEHKRWPSKAFAMGCAIGMNIGAKQVLRPLEKEIEVLEESITNANEMNIKWWFKRNYDPIWRLKDNSE